MPIPPNSCTVIRPDSLLTREDSATWRQSVGEWKFFVTQGQIEQATLHDKIQSNCLLRGLFKKYYNNRSGDFVIFFDGIETILSVPWQDLINYSHIVMLFGKSFDQSCPWGPVFWFKTNPKYTHHVFQWFASKYFGDTRVSSKLFAAYKDCLCSSFQANAESLSILKRRTKLPNFNNNNLKFFFSRFDDICQHSFLNCFSTFNDYSIPILRTANFTNYLNVLKHIFPTQWDFFLRIAI